MFVHPTRKNFIAPGQSVVFASVAQWNSGLRIDLKTNNLVVTNS